MTMATDVTEGAERLIASAEQNDGIMLGELAQAELCTLRGEAVSLVCERTRRWWTQLSTDERRELGHLALELMVIRGLLRPPQRRPRLTSGSCKPYPRSPHRR